MTTTSEESTFEENTPSPVYSPITQEDPSFTKPLSEDVPSAVLGTISATSRESSINEEETTAILNDTNYDDVREATTFLVEENSTNTEGYLTHDGTAITTILHLSLIHI